MHRDNIADIKLTYSIQTITAARSFNNRMIEVIA